MSRIFVSGSVAYDRIMNFPGLFRDHFVEGKLHNINVSFQVENLKEQFGGTAGNIAYTLALLGEAPTILASVGSDFDRYRAWLLENNIDPTTLAIVHDSLTATAQMMTDQGNNQIAAFYPGAASVAYGMFETVGAELAIVAPGGLDDMRALPKHCKENKIPYFYDPGQQIIVLSAEDLKEGITGAEVVFVNDYELGMITQKTGWGEKEIIAHAQTLVVTLGEQGSRIVTKEGETAIKGVEVEKVVDPTGAGDTYRAGFAKGFVSKMPLKVCGQLASAVASYAVEHHGTQNHRFTSADVAARYQATFGETIVL